MTKRLMKYSTALAAFLCLVGQAIAQEAAAPKAFKPSTCHAVAEMMPQDAFPQVHFASFTPAASPTRNEVAISYQGHSTYLIETGQGVKIATDFAGYLRSNIIPDIVTMNRAHSSHYTNNPDPRIAHILPGWGSDGQAADHYITVEDVLVRNVTTDILRFTPMPDGNSIFIFEVAGLCIGHLGHLHHQLTDEHFAEIGRLDIVMVPVDGGMTLTHTSASMLLDRLRSSIVLPMHVRSSGALPRFLSHLGERFAVNRLSENNLIVSLRTLPKQPTVMLLPGVSRVPDYSE